MELLGRLASLKQHHGFMKYFRNMSWLFAEKILRMVVALLVGVWVARHLGPERFGLLSYAQSFVAIFTVFAPLGLDSIVVRELVNDQEKRDKLLGTGFILKLIGAIGVLALLAIAVFVQGNDLLTNTLIFIVASSTIFQSFNVIDFYFQSKVLSKFVVFSNTTSLLLSSIIKIVLLLNEAPLIAFAIMILFESMVLAAGFIYFYFKQKASPFKWSFDGALAKQLLKESWPLIFTSFVISIYMKVDQVMIKEMLGVADVGQYAVAVKLCEIWYFIPYIITSSLFPAIINAKKESEGLYYTRLQRLYDFMMLVALTIAIPMSFLGDWVVSILYGEQYFGAGEVLGVYIWASVFIYIGVASAQWFIIEGLQKYSLYRTLAGCVLNILLNLYMIPTYGIYGAAIATIISQTVASYLFNAMSRKTWVTFKLQSKAFLFPLRFKELKNLKA